MRKFRTRAHKFALWCQSINDNFGLFSANNDEVYLIQLINALIVNRNFIGAVELSQTKFYCVDLK